MNGDWRMDGNTYERREWRENHRIASVYSHSHSEFIHVLNVKHAWCNWNAIVFSLSGKRQTKPSHRTVENQNNVVHKMPCTTIVAVGQRAVDGQLDTRTRESIITCCSFVPLIPFCVWSFVCCSSTLSLLFLLQFFSYFVFRSSLKAVSCVRAFIHSYGYCLIDVVSGSFCFCSFVIPAAFCEPTDLLSSPEARERKGESRPANIYFVSVRLVWCWCVYDCSSSQQ